jgi:hypothetical protein
MKQRVFFLTFLILLGFASSLKAQRYVEWSKQINHLGKLGVSALATHKDNIYATGFFSDSLKLGSLGLASVGKEDVFLIKLDPGGRPQWATQIGSKEHDQASTILAKGNQILLGGSTSAVDSGSQKSDSLSKALFVSAWDTAGLNLWQSTFPYNGVASLDMLAQGSDSTVLVGGMIHGSIFVPEKYTSGRRNSAFIAQLSAEGELLEYAISSGGGQHRAIAAARQQNGHMLVMFAATKGLFELKGPEIDLVYNMEADGLLIFSLTPSFEMAWAVSIEANGFAEGVKLFSVRDNSIIAGVNFNGTISCASKQVQTSAQLATALIRLDELGSLMDMQLIANNEYCRLKDMAVMYDNSLMITGYFSGSSLFGDSLADLSNRNAFIAQLGSKGQLIWHDAIQLGDDHAGRAVSLGPDADVFIGGGFKPKSSNASGIANTNGLQNGLFVNRYKNCKPLPLKLIAPPMMCPEDTLHIEATPGYAAYVWANDRTTNNTLIVTEPGTYSLLVEDKYGCEASDTIQLGTYPPTVFTFGDDVELTPGESIDLRVDSTYIKYTWSDNYQSRHRLIGYGEKEETLLLGLSVQASGHCPAHDTLVVSFTETQSLSLFKAYPVPTKNILNWAWSGVEQKLYSISIVDTHGAVLYEEQIDFRASAYSDYISLASFRPGAYLLRLHTSNGSINRLIVKQ